MDKSIGIELREARREKGMGLPEVSSVLCISKTYLRGLEECNDDQLPDAAFAIGFLRTYAEYLGLNADDLVGRAKEQPVEASDDAADKPAKGEASETKEIGVKAPLKNHDSSMPAIPLVMTVIGGVMSLAVAIGMYEPGTTSLANAETSPLEVRQSNEANQSNEDSKSIETSKPIEASMPIEASSSASVVTEPVQEDVVASVQAPVQAKVEIVAANDAWISLRDAEDQPLYRDVLTKGERYSFPAAGAVHLATGHPENIQVFVDGRQLHTPLHQGSVVRDWRINAASDGGVISHSDESTSEE